MKVGPDISRKFAPKTKSELLDTIGYERNDEEKPKTKSQT